MKHLKLILLSFLILFILGIFSCEKDPMITDQETSLSSLDLDKTPQMKQLKDCFNFRTDGTAALGCVTITSDFLPFEFPCASFSSFGAIEFPVTIGDYEGFMGSVVTNMYQSGKGALHLNLVHYFVSEEGAWWTEDQAVCAPTRSNPGTCLVNDVLNIVGGTGIFEGISGKFHNHGELTFGPPENCINCIDDPDHPDYPPQVPTGELDFEIFGRICINVNGPE